MEPGTSEDTSESQASAGSIQASQDVEHVDVEVGDADHLQQPSDGMKDDEDLVEIIDNETMVDKSKDCDNTTDTVNLAHKSGEEIFDLDPRPVIQDCIVLCV